jgi:peroxiredoxin
MANQLTGDFDIVGEAGVQLVNRLVRAMHQNGAKDPGLNLPVVPHQLAADVVNDSAGQTVSGSAFVQVGVRSDPPVLQLVAGAPSDVRIRCPIRALYDPDPGTQPLPEFLLGDVHARYAITLETESGVLGVRATASEDDKEIAFYPDAKQEGASQAQIAAVSGALRRVLRNSLPAFLPLPAEFQGAPPILLGLVDASGKQAVAAPVSLSGSGGDPAAVTRVFAESNEIAIAVGKEFILAPVQAQLDDLKANPPSFPVKLKGYSLATYKTTITTATATWSEGMVVTITIEGTANALGTAKALGFPKVSFSVTVPVQLTFSGGSLSVFAADKPDVKVSVGGYLGDKVEPKADAQLTNRVIEERNKALDQANTLLGQASGQTDRLQTLLRSIDDKAALFLSTAEYDPDGLILRGFVTLSPPKSGRVTFSPLANGKGYTAFESWVPGGWVEGFHWTWFSIANVWGAEPGKIEQRYLYDRFVIEEEGLPVKRAGQGPVLTMGYSQLCLELLGGAGVAKLVPGKSCGVPYHPGPKVYPPKQPVKYPDPAGRIREIGHIDLDGLRDRLATNLLVQRVAGEPLVDVLRRVEASFREAARPDAALTVAFVVPKGSFRQVAGEAARIRRRRSARGNVDVLVVEDIEGGWSSTYDIRATSRTNASRLVDPGGRLVWEHDGVLDQRTLAGAFQEHLRTAPPAGVELVTAGVRAGQVAPHFHFDGVSGGRLTLRWLHGRLVVLVFAEAEAAPSLRALKNLKRLERSAERHRLFPLAVLDGTRRKAAMVRRDLRLGYPVVPDPDGMISGRYGIRCWPTTVVIDRDGQVANVSLGAG